MNVKSNVQISVGLFLAALCACSKGSSDAFPVVIIDREVYNAYDVKSTQVVRISRESVDEIIRTEPKNPLALFVAATRGDADLAKKLLQQGADPNHKTDFGHYPLHEAVRVGNRRIVELLLAAGAQVNVRVSPRGPDTPNQWTPLHFAAYGGHTDIAEKLIERGADLSPKDLWGKTPLNYALEQKHVELVAFLKAKGASE